MNIEIATERFGDMEARDSLVRESLAEPIADRKGFGIHELKQAVLEGRPLNAIGGDGNVVPFRAVQLYRSLLARQSLSYSQMARAARTSDDMRRQIGDFELNVVTDEDAVFLMVSPVTSVVPTKLTLINDDGRMQVLQLPAPINAAQQIGFTAGEAETDALLALLDDPATSIFIG